MKKALPLCTILALGMLFCVAALAQTPTPQAPTPEQLQEAIFAPAGGAVAPDTNPTPEYKLLCSPMPDDACVYWQCECVHHCGACGGISSFTCSESTGTHSCKCKTC